MLKRKKYKVYPTLLSNIGNNTDNLWLSGPLDLNDNDDVNITDPQNGDTLIYNEVTNQWESRPQIKTWLTESHQIGDSSLLTNNEYHGGQTIDHDSTNWANINWDKYFVNEEFFNWDIDRGALRPIPYDNVTKLFFNGQISVYTGTLTEIGVYSYPCLNSLNESVNPPELTCIGRYITGINQSQELSVASTCMNFEIDLIETLGTGDMILISVKILDSFQSSTNTSAKLPAPFLVNFNLSLETRNPSLEFNAAYSCNYYNRA